MAVTIFQDVFAKMDSAVINVLGTKTSQVMNIVSPVIMSAFILYVLLIAISYIKNGTDPSEIGVDILQRLLSWAVIIGLAFNMGNYTSIVVPMVQGIPQDIIGVITGTNSTDVTNSLDALVTLYTDKLAELFANIDFADIGGYISASLIALILIIFGLPFLIIAGGYILLAKIMVAILLCLAPIFIGLALFPATRQFASLWVSQVVNYGILLLVISILATIQIDFLTNVVNTTVDLDASAGFMIGITSGIFLIVLLKAPELASALSGGMVLNGWSAGGRALGGAGKAMGGAVGKNEKTGQFNSPTMQLGSRLASRFTGGKGGNSVKPEKAGK